MIGPFPDEDVIRSSYSSRYAKLDRVARSLRIEIERQLKNDSEVVIVQSRAKDIESYVEKALRTNESTGKRKYKYPLEEIQDQVGCRVVVKSPLARKTIANLMARHFGHLEKQYKIAKDPMTFGYAAHHVVCPIPAPLRLRENLDADAFEIQVATLFQFAWSQMEHAIGYKAGRLLTREQRRNLACAAALAETADGLFSRVRHAAAKATPQKVARVRKARSR